MVSKYAFYSESDKALVIKNRSGIECTAETDNLLFLMKLYDEIVWKGLNYFGLTTTGVNVNLPRFSHSKLVKVSKQGS